MDHSVGVEYINWSVNIVLIHEHPQVRYGSCIPIPTECILPYIRSHKFSLLLMSINSALLNLTVQRGQIELHKTDLELWRQM